jgi:hypothetical protein
MSDPVESSSARRAGLARTFAVPAAIAAVSGAGLILALLADGIADPLACAAVAVPFGVVAWAWKYRG